MNRALPLLLGVLGVLVSAVSSPASTSSVALTHTLTATTGHGTASSFSIHVENAGDAPVSNLTLSFVPRAPFVRTPAKLSVGNLGARQGTDVPVKLNTFVPVPAQEVSSRSALFFDVSYVDGGGQTVKFRTVSRMPPKARVQAMGNGAAARPSLAAAADQTGPGGYLLQWGVKYHFANPFGLAVDSGGNVYVADTENFVIEKFDSSGNTVAVWGGLGSDNGQFIDPEGVAVDAAGNVYVSDTVNNRIQKFDSNGTFLTAWGSYGSGNGQFYDPRGVAVDSSGNVYVADYENHRIQKFSGSGALLAVWDKVGTEKGQTFSPFKLAVAPTGEVYATDPLTSSVHKFDSNGNLLLGWEVSTSIYFSPVTGVAVDSSGKVYVAYYEAILVFDPSGNLLATWSSYGTGDGQVEFPCDLALDRAGNLLVLDTYNLRIEKFNMSGDFLSAWESSGSANGLFSYPQGVALDGSGNVYVVDSGNNRVQKFDGSGNFLTAWGSEGSGNGQFSNPAGVAVDVSGNVYVTDPLNRRVQEFDSSGNFIKAWGYSQWAYTGPAAVAVDREANLFLGDIERQYLEKFDNSGNFLFETHGCSPFVPPSDAGFFPQGVALDGGGNIYVTNAATYGVEKLDKNGTCVAAWIRYYENPFGIAADGSGNVYAVDSGFNNVVVQDTNGNLRGSFGSTGIGNGQFRSPTGVAADKPGSRVYVSDSTNNRIQLITGYGTTHFAVSAPSSATAGTPFKFTVTALDAANDTATGYAGTVQFSSSDRSAVLPGASLLTNGTGTFSATLKTAGSQTITASATGTPPVTGTSNPIVVKASTLVPDLTIDKRHSGSFQRGHRAAYRITVKNSGKAATTGAVTVTDRLPRGLVLSGISGNGWTCSSRTLSCRTGRVAAPGASYPAITVTVTVADSAPSSVTNTATVSGGGEINTSNNTARDTATVKPKGKK